MILGIIYKTLIVHSLLRKMEYRNILLQKKFGVSKMDHRCQIPAEMHEKLNIKSRMQRKCLVVMQASSYAIQKYDYYVTLTEE